MLESNTPILIIYLLAISTEAVSGAIAAGRRSMDIFGIVFVAFLTALGGGTVRDIVLGNYPINWTQHTEHIYLVVFFGLFAIVLQQFLKQLENTFLVLDSLGLIAFTLIGCSVATDLNYSSTLVVMSGLMTGIFGGIIRDILCHRTPQVLRQELYASISLVIGILYLYSLNLYLLLFLGFLLRLVAIKYNLRLPTPMREKYEH